MSLGILFRTYPERSLALVSDSHALIFRHNAAPANQASASVPNPSTPLCMVESASLSSVDLSEYEVLRPLGVHGTLGLVNVNSDVFLCVITGATSVAVVRPDEHVQRIISVEFCERTPEDRILDLRLVTDVATDCINKPEFDVHRLDETSLYDDNDDEHDHVHSSSPRDPTVEHPCVALKKLLDDGTFYYSVDFDLTNRLQDR